MIETTAPQATTQDAPAFGEQDHFFCPFCYERPQNGDLMYTLCGEIMIYSGHHYEASDEDCPACALEAIRTQQTWACPRCA
jgi:endogenous inhibitor of DNA gyrase (YacG/DUF329 family)